MPKLSKTYTVIVTGADLQNLTDMFKLAGYRDLPCNAASRHDGLYSLWGSSHVMARIMLEMLANGIENLGYRHVEESH